MPSYRQYCWINSKSLWFATIFEHNYNRIKNSFVWSTFINKINSSYGNWKNLIKNRHKISIGILQVCAINNIKSIVKHYRTTRGRSSLQRDHLQSWFWLFLIIIEQNILEIESSEKLSKRRVYSCVFICPKHQKRLILEFHQIS